MDIANNFADFQQTNLLKHVNTSIEKSKNYKARTALDDVKSGVACLIPISPKGQFDDQEFCRRWI
jgi:hypothetical protein